MIQLFNFFGIIYAEIVQTTFIEVNMKYILIIFTALFIQSCSSNFLDNMKGNLANKQVNQTKDEFDYSAPTSQLNKTRDLLDGASINFPTLTATGYAVVSSQPGQSIEQKRLMAIRSARMSAMRDLAEQIHGLKVDSNTTVIDLMVQNDTFRGVVSGVIRGAGLSELIQQALILMKQFLRSIKIWLHIYLEVLKHYRVYVKEN